MFGCQRAVRCKAERRGKAGRRRKAGCCGAVGAAKARCCEKLDAAEELDAAVWRCGGGRSESRSCPPSRGSSVGSGDRLPTAKQMAAMAGAISGAKVSSGQCLRGFGARSWRENDHGRTALSGRIWRSCEVGAAGERCAAGWRGRTTAGGWGAERAHLAKAGGAGREDGGWRRWRSWGLRGTKLAQIVKL